MKKQELILENERLKKWWRESKYPEPMEIEQGNFIPASCYEWAVECFAKAV